MKPVSSLIAELGPLIEAALERHRAIEVDDDSRRRQVEEHDGDEPEDDVRRALLRRDADPRQADDEQDLREGQIREPEVLAEPGAVRIDATALAARSRTETPGAPWSLPSELYPVRRGRDDRESQCDQLPGV